MKVGGGPARAESTNNTGINYVEATIKNYDVMGVASKPPASECVGLPEFCSAIRSYGVINNFLLAISDQFCSAIRSYGVIY
jgi:hypothetical protein